MEAEAGLINKWHNKTDVDRMMDCLTELFDDHVSSAKWLTESNVALGGKTPAEYIGETTDVQGVINILERMVHGIIQ
jgi:uncharacterized protein (DUF2384 family)